MDINQLMKSAAQLAQNISPEDKEKMKELEEKLEKEKQEIRRKADEE
jgi:hypothetical protein